MRFTIRRLMVATAVVAVASGASAGLWRRSTRMRAIADHHEALQRRTEAFVIACGPTSSTSWSEPTPLSLYHGRLKDKYLYAAKNPWFPVRADPPPPPPRTRPE